MVLVQSYILQDWCVQHRAQAGHKQITSLPSPAPLHLTAAIHTKAARSQGILLLFHAPEYNAEEAENQESSPVPPLCAQQGWGWQPGLQRGFPSASSLEASPETCSVSFPFSIRWQAFPSVTFTLTVVLLLLLECFDLSHGRCHKLVFTKLNTRGLSVLAWRQGFR